MKKNLYALFFGLMLFAQAIPTNAREIKEKNSLGQTIIYETIAREGGNCLQVVGVELDKKDTICIIPEEVLGGTVIAIGEKVFYGKKNLQHIQIPETIEIIGEDAFKGTNLVSFKFPKNLKFCEDDAFSSSWISEYAQKIIHEYAGKSFGDPELRGHYVLYMFDHNSLYYKNYTTNVVHAALDYEQIQKFLREDKQYLNTAIMTNVECNGELSSANSIVVSESDTAKISAFSDENLSIAVSFVKNYIAISLTNETKKTMKIIWDETSYIGVDGRSTPLIEGHTPSIDRTKAVKPTVLMRGAKYTGFLLPLDEHDILLSPSKSFQGKKVYIMLPVEVNSERFEYFFEFVIKYNDFIGA